ncbi:MAG: hypothetical protein ACRDGM_03120 [bacterium]
MRRSFLIPPLVLYAEFVPAYSPSMSTPFELLALLARPAPAD